MLRSAVRITSAFSIPIFGQKHENDYDMLNRPLTDRPNTGWDRVKNMYKRNEFEEISIELANVVQSSLCGAFFGVCIGGFVQSRAAYLYFIENNQATIFKTTLEAKKKLQDHVTLAFAKGAYRWGWRLGAFTGLFSLIATTISVYRDNTSVLEYVTAGAITGGLYKAHLGLAATFVGAGLGAVLSALAGAAILSILKVTNVSMDDIRRALHRIQEAREDQLNQAADKYAVIRNDDLTRHHDTLVKEKGVENIDNVK